MPTVAVVVIVAAVAVLSLLAIGLTALALLRHLKSMARSIDGVRTDLDRELAQLAAETEHTQRELIRLADASAASRGRRAAQR